MRSRYSCGCRVAAGLLPVCVVAYGSSDGAGNVRDASASELPREVSEQVSADEERPTRQAGGNSERASGGEATRTEASDEVEPCSASANLQSGDTTRTITVDGVERSFLVHAPPGYDVALVRELLSVLADDACIEERRIHSRGCSNGGGMSYKLACEATDIIAAVAPVDFDCVDGVSCGACESERPVTVVQFRGTNDQLVDYEGNGPFVGAQQNLAIWGELNQCTGLPEAVAGSEGCEAFPSCGAGAQTVLCAVQEGTHCGSYGAFQIPEVAWRVLQNEVLP